MRKYTSKRSGLGLSFKTFIGASGKSYLVFQTPKGAYHVFAETEAKEAARDCGAKSGNTREQWKSIWDAYAMRKVKDPELPVSTPRGESLLTRLKSQRKV